MTNRRVFLKLCPLFLSLLHALPPPSKDLTRRAAARIGNPRLLELEIYTSNVGYEMNTMVFDTGTASNATHGCEYKGYLSGLVNNQACFFDGGDQASDPAFVWAMESFTCVDNFTLRFEHWFIDPDIGPCATPPGEAPLICETHTWALATLTPDLLTCSHDLSADLPGGYHGCHLTTPGLDAVVYQISA